MRTLFCLLALASAATLQAQRVPPQAPDAVVREYFDAIQKGRFIEAARHLDTVWLVGTRQHLLELYRDLEPPRTMSVEEFMKADTAMPRVVAEYQAKMMQRAFAEPFNVVLHTFADVPDTVALKLLSTRELAARWLEAQDPRYHFRQSMLRCRRRADSTAINVDSAVRTILVPQKEILGLVARRDTAWVVYRALQSVAYTPPMEPEVETLVLRDRWRVLPADNLGSGGLAMACAP